MEVYKRPNSPFYYVDIVHPGTGERRRVSTKEKTKGAANSAALRIAQELEAEAKEAKDGKLSVTVRAALDEYVAHAESAGLRSAYQYAAMRDKTLGLKPVFEGRYRLDGDKPLHTLEPADVERLIRARRDEGNSAQTIAHEIKLLRAATRYAAGLKWRVPTLMTDGTSKNPWRVPKLATKTRYLSPEEFQRVFDYMSPDRPITGLGRGGKPAEPYVAGGARRQSRQDAQDLLVALALTGGRWQEVASLTWDRVCFETDTIMIWGAKGEEDRPVPIPAPAREVLERRYKARDKAEPAIFPGRFGGFRSSGSCQPILRAMEAVGLNRPDIVAKHGRATVHSLRHTFASWLLQNGAELSDVKDALGHKSLQMTLRYAHLQKRRTAARLGAILNGVTVLKEPAEAA